MVRSRFAMLLSSCLASRGRHLHLQCLFPSVPKKSPWVRSFFVFQRALTVNYVSSHAARAKARNATIHTQQNTHSVTITTCRRIDYYLYPNGGSQCETQRHSGQQRADIIRRSADIVPVPRHSICAERICHSKCVLST